VALNISCPFTEVSAYIIECIVVFLLNDILVSKKKEVY
jgi:hypothetical protein